PVVSFDGAADAVTRVHATNPLNGFPTGDADRSMFAVIRYGGATANAGFGYGNGSANQAFALIAQTSTGYLTLQGWGGGNDRVTSLVLPGAGWMIQGVVHSSGNSTLYVDGSTVDSWSHTFATSL